MKRVKSTARRARSAAVALGALGAMLSGAACSAEVTGEILVAVDSDLSLPKDIDKIQIEVISGGAVKGGATLEDFSESTGAKLPATHGVIVPEDPSQPVTVRVTASRGDEARVRREVTTTIPEDRVATLRVPVQFLCRATNAEEQSEGVCPPERFDASDLPDYATEAISGGSCFDVARCLQGARRAVELDQGAEHVAVLHRDTCTLTLPEGGDVNVALEDEGDGICNSSGCYVVLDAGDARGWTRLSDGTIQLPKAACEGNQRALDVVTTPVSAGCLQKVPSLPTCGTWSTASWETYDGPVAIAGAQDFPVALALGANQVTWVNQGSSDGEAHGSVKQVASAGGTPVELEKDQQNPRGVALDGGTVYWVNQGVANDGEIIKRDAGGTLSPLFSGLSVPEGIVISSGKLFWTEVGSHDDPGAVSYVDVSGGAKATIPGASGSPYRIAAAKDRLFWSDSVHGSVKFIDLNDQGIPSGSVGSVAEEQNAPQTIALDVDADGNTIAVYWVNMGTMEDQGTIVRTLGSLGSTPELLATAQSFPTGIAVDAANVYWTNRSAGTVMRIPKEGGVEPEVIAEGQRNPGAIAVDENAIFWVNEGSSGARDGTVVRLAK